MSTNSYPDAFKFRLNCIDHYQASPSTFDVRLPAADDTEDARNSATIPIIRIFGATETGQKVCAHIHGAFPYLFVEYKGSLEQSDVNAFIQTFAASVNQALAISYRRNAYQSSLTSYVAHISLVKGVPFYGFHVGYRYYLKIYLRNPAHMTRFADLLHQGAILGRVTQPYESHLQYLLQWMCDYNLYGCAIVACEQVSFRCPIPSAASVSSQGHKWHDGSVLTSAILDKLEFQRQSHCSLEVDIHLPHILNRLEVRARPIHQDFSERFLRSQAMEKFVPSMAGLWKDETIRRKRRHEMQHANDSPFPPEALISMSAGTRGAKFNWVHEDTFTGMVQEIIDEEKNVEGAAVTFEAFDSLCQETTGVQTVIESVSDLYPGRVSSRAFCLTPTGQPTQASVDDNGHILPVVNQDNIVLLSNTEVEAYYSDDEYNDDELDTEDGEEMLLQGMAMNAPSGSSHSIATGNDLGVIDDFLPPSPTPRKKTESGLNTIPQLLYSDSPVAKPLTQRRMSNGGSDLAVFNPRSRIGVVESDSDVNADQLALGGSKQPHSLSVLEYNNPTSTSGGAYNVKPVSNQPKSSILISDSSPRRLVQPPTSQSTAGGKSAPEKDDDDVSVDQALKLKARLRAAPRNKVLLRREVPHPKRVPELLRKSDQPTILHGKAYYSSEYDLDKQISIDKRQNEDTMNDEYFSNLSRKVNALRSAHELNVAPEVVNAQQDCLFRAWKFAKPPPTRRQVKRWLSCKQSRPGGPRQQYQTNRQLNTSLAKTPRKKVARPIAQQSSNIIETQYMSAMSLEIFTSSRGDLAPDPAEDEVRCIFWSVQSETGSSEDDYTNGIITATIDQKEITGSENLVGAIMDFEETELELINRLVDVVRDLDPDILVGYEVHNGSWGYLIERSRLKYEFDLCNDLSRVNFGSRGRFGKEADRWGFTHTSTIRITGRHMMNIWRAMRGELNLLQYTIENVAYRLLRIRIPHYSFYTLTTWYRTHKFRDLARMFNYFLLRVQLNLKIFQAVDMVAKTSEQARLLGVDFFSVISRGSQFKVESLMFRIAKPENFILISPSRKQVGQQNALECLPLVMEPQSNFYTSPVLVLDFQSLYPSIMIAYNYCYSTCLGRIASWRGKNKLGVVDYQRRAGLMEVLQHYLSIAPNGLLFVRPEIRRSLLAKMLTEILETRIMVKSGMKVDKKDKALQRLLNNRQLALKLIANVTYGYTSASFSGRFPCAEIADSIVQSARETLEKAIASIHSVEKWGAEVVYGDTDSLFVHLKGKSRAEAFKIGKEIADTITSLNPRPVKLKFEKVYHPCVLLAKKRYVGFKYENPTQTMPDFDAKGIETVRRDGTPAEQRIEERALRILFRTQDLSKVRSYFQTECLKIMTGNVNIQDFLFAKEVKLGMYSDKGPGPPGALVATKKMLADRRLEPQYGERVPYVVIAGAPGARLIDRCVDPDELLADDQAELDAEYYITKNLIPPLERIFTLVGANVRGWYDEMSKSQHLRVLQHVDPTLVKAVKFDDQMASKRTLETYMQEKTCLICSRLFTDHDESSDENETMENDSKTPEAEQSRSSSSSDRNTSEEEVSQSNDVLDLKGLVCDDCLYNVQRSVFKLQRRLADSESQVQAMHKICRDCSSLTAGQQVQCDSKDCPIYYSRVRGTSMMRSLCTRVHLLTRKLM